MSEETQTAENVGGSKPENLIGEVKEEVVPTEPVPAPEPSPSSSAEALAGQMEATANEAENVSEPESNFALATLDKSTPQITTDPVNPNITIEKTPDTVTITEIMTPLPSPEASVGQAKTFLASLLPKLKEKLLFRTEKRLAKIIEFARKKSSQGESIKNDDVEKLLRVSDTTAAVYLKKLTKRGSLKVSGSKKGTVYTL